MPAGEGNNLLLRLRQNFGALGVILFRRNLVGLVSFKQRSKLCFLGGGNRQRRRFNRPQTQFLSGKVCVDLVCRRHHLWLDCGRSGLYRADGNGPSLRRGGLDFRCGRLDRHRARRGRRCGSNRRSCPVLLVQFGHFLFQCGPRLGLGFSIGSRRRCLDRFRGRHGFLFRSRNCRSRVSSGGPKHDYVFRLAWLCRRGAGGNDHNRRRGGMGRLRFQRVHFFHQCRARGG